MENRGFNQAKHVWSLGGLRPSSSARQLNRIRTNLATKKETKLVVLLNHVLTEVFGYALYGCDPLKYDCAIIEQPFRENSQNVGLSTFVLFDQ